MIPEILWRLNEDFDNMEAFDTGGSDEEGQQCSSVQDFYDGAVVMVTGATGFMGKVLVEKLLRSCPRLSTLFLMVRPKGDRDTQSRVLDYLNDPLFNSINGELRQKVKAVDGDLVLPSLGLSVEDRKLLEASVEVVFHCAATVRFDEPLRRAIHVNVIGAKEVLMLAKAMPKLKAYVHVSTAFSNCRTSEGRDKEIGETIYKPPFDYANLSRLADSVDDELLERITPVILEGWPNTYVYTKSVAEDMVKQLGKGLPTCIFRPAIVVGSREEPTPGWVDNMYGATGVVVGCGTGVLRTLRCDGRVTAHVVPVDMAVNALITSAYMTATGCKTLQRPSPQWEWEENAPLVFNYVTSRENQITWSEFMSLAVRHGNEVPPLHTVWCYCLTLHTSWLAHAVSVLLFHYLPALIMDGVAKLIRKPASMVATYRKVHKFSDLLTYFTTREWKFREGNVRQMWADLGSSDRALFPFDMATIQWDTYFYAYVRGVRYHLLHEDPATVPQAKTRLKRFSMVHKVMKYLTAFLFIRFIWFIFSGFL